MHTKPTVSPDLFARPAAPRRARRPAVLRRAAAHAVERLEDRRLFALPGLNNGTWVSAGPTSLTNPSGLAGTQTAIGQASSIATDPANPNVYYVGTTGGGIWKTTDGGTTYVPQIDGQPALNIGAIAIAPSNASVVYAGTGTGDENVDSFYGQGIYRTVNGGATWELLASTQFARQSFEKIAVDPTNSGILYAAVNDGQRAGVASTSGTLASGGAATPPTGIYKSTDGGATWTDTTGGFTTSDNFYDVEIDPVTPTTIYATTQNLNNGQGGIYVTTNGGLTWNPTGAFPAPLYDPSLGGNVNDSTGGFGLGNTQSTNIVYGRISLAIAPDKPGTIYAAIASQSGLGANGLGGDPNLFGLPNPGDAANYGVDPGFLLVSVDGGTTWTQIVNVPTYATAGELDNAIIIDRANPSIFYLGGTDVATDVNGNFTGEALRGSFAGLGTDFFGLGTNATATFTDITVGTAGNTGLGFNVDGYAFDADNRLIAVTDQGVFRLDNPQSATVTWTNISGNIGNVLTRSVSLAASASDGLVASASALGVIGLAGASSSTSWNTLYDGAYVQDVVADPTNASVIYAVTADTSIDQNTGLSNFVQKSTDGGATFTPASAGVDQLPTNTATQYRTIVIDPDNHLRLLLASGTSLYETLNGATSWHLLNTFSSDITSLGVGNHGVSQGPDTTETQRIYVATADGTISVSTNDSNPPIVAGGAPKPDSRANFLLASSIPAVTGVIDAQFLTSLPIASRTFVENVTVDPLDSALAYAVVSGFASATLGTSANAIGGHIYATIPQDIQDAFNPASPLNVIDTVSGVTPIDPTTVWTDITGDLPNIPVHDVVVLPAGQNGFLRTLYAATDRGVYVSYNEGLHWQRAGAGLPDAPVQDLALDPATGVLAAATVGRGVWEFSTAFAGGTISARVFSDVHATGLSDPSEPGIAGAAVALRTPGADGIIGTSDDVTVATHTSDGNGVFAFTNLPAGTYYEHVTVPATYNLSPVYAGPVAAAVIPDETAGLVGYDPAPTLGNVVDPVSGNSGPIVIADAGTVSPTQAADASVGVYQKTVIVTNPQVTRPTTTGATATLSFTVTISPSNAGTTVTIPYTTANGTAIAGTDYTAASGTLTFAAGVTTQTVVVTVLGSPVVQVNKTLSLNITAPAGFVTPDLVNPALIVNGAVPVVSIGNATITRDAIASTKVSVPVTLNTAAPFDTSVVVSTAAGTAGATTDFNAADYTVYFPAGTTTATAIFTAFPGTNPQLNKTFTVGLSYPLGLAINPAATTGTVTIVSNALPTVTTSGATVVEGVGGPTMLQFTVSLSASIPEPVTVNYATADGTALAGTDYTAVAGTLTFAPGQVQQTVAVPIARRIVAAQTLTFGLTLSAPSGGVQLGAAAAATGTIVDPGTNAINFAGGKQRAVYVDNLGQRVTITIRGPGAGQVIYVGATPAQSDATALVLNGTTSRSVVTVTVSKGGQTSFNQITVNGDLNTFSAKPVNLTGAFTSTGAASVITLGYMAASTMTIGGTAGSVALTFNRVVDSSITSAIAIRSIVAGAYVNSDGVPDFITAPSVGRRRIKGVFGATIQTTAT